LLDLIRDRGGLVLDCDAIYHQLLRTDAALLQAIENRFPGTVENGQLQRKKLGAIVFRDPDALQDLNRITHSAITAEVLHQLKSQPKLAAIDAIALFESGLHRLCDVTVAITAPTEDRIRRLMARDGISEDYARSRIAAQPSNEDFSFRCDHTLENSGEIHVFQSNCLAFLREIGIMEL
jgi:L-threonylcarbamoyladenylate synthase